MLSACSDDVDLRQKRIDNPRGSVSPAVGSVRLLAVRIVAPQDAVPVKGDNVGLFLTLANDGNGSDALTSVSARQQRRSRYGLERRIARKASMSRSRRAGSRRCSTPGVRTSSW